MKFPEFIIIGAAKCGTTALWYNLDKHPDIHMATRTTNSIEVHFWGFNNWKNRISWYKGLFPNNKICGEKSVSYWTSSKAIRLMKEYNPNVKLILCIRNPFTRAHSNFQMHNRRTNARLTFPVFEGRYAGQGKYITHIKNRILKHFPREQLYICVQEKMKVNVTKEMKKVFEFLGVTDLNLPAKEIDPILLKDRTRKEDRELSRKEKFYRVWSRYNRIEDVVLKNQIVKYYNPYNKKLFKFLGYEIKEWNK